MNRSTRWVSCNGYLLWLESCSTWFQFCHVDHVSSVYTYLLTHFIYPKVLDCLKGFNFNSYRYEKTFHHAVQHPSRKASSLRGYRVSSTICCAIQDYPLWIVFSILVQQIYNAVPCGDVTTAPSLLTSDSRSRTASATQLWAVKRGWRALQSGLIQPCIHGICKYGRRSPFQNMRSISRAML